MRRWVRPSRQRAACSCTLTSSSPARLVPTPARSSRSAAFSTQSCASFCWGALSRPQGRKPWGQVVSWMEIACSELPFYSRLHSSGMSISSRRDNDFQHVTGIPRACAPLLSRHVHRSVGGACVRARSRHPSRRRSWSFSSGASLYRASIWASTPRSGSRRSLRSAAFSWFLRRFLAAERVRTRKASRLGKPRAPSRKSRNTSAPSVRTRL